MTKINFNTVYNDFGDTLPGKSEFFNDTRNEVTRVILRYRYKVDSDCRAYLLFKDEYAEFLKGLKKPKVDKDETK